MRDINDIHLSLFTFYVDYQQQSSAIPFSSLQCEIRAADESRLAWSSKALSRTQAIGAAGRLGVSPADAQDKGAAHLYIHAYFAGTKVDWIQFRQKCF